MTKFLIIILALFSSQAFAAGVDLDGRDITNDFANAPWYTFQNVQSGWGGADLMALYVKTNDTHLLVGIPAFAVHEHRRCLVLFIDDNVGTGSNVMPSGLDGLTHVKGMAGMSFDTEFTPDRTVTLAVEANGFSYVDIEKIIENAAVYLGSYNVFIDGGAVTNENGTIVAGYMPWSYSLSETNTAAEGLEIALSYDDLENISSTIRVMAVIANFDCDWTSNQTLPPSGTNTVGRPSNELHYDQVPGKQYMEIILPAVDTSAFFYVSADMTQTKLFAVSSVNELTASAQGGTPPYSFTWDLGNGTVTNGAHVAYSYPVDGQFNTTAVIADNGGFSETVDVGQVTVMPETFVDGRAIPADFAGQGTSVYQDTASNWGTATVPGTGSELDALYAFSEVEKLYVGLCGNMPTGKSEQVMAVFIDCNYGTGSNVMPAVSAGAPAKLQNLQGMTFDTSFTPDIALVFSIGQWYDYWVNYYDIINNTDTYWPEKTEWHSIFDPFQRVYHENTNDLAAIAAFNNNNTAASPNEAETGFECMLTYDILCDSPAMMTQKTIKIQALIFNYETGYIANQSLPGIGGDAAGYGAAGSVSYAAVPGNQYIEINAPVIPEPAGVLLFVGLLCLYIRKLRNS